MKNKKTIHRIGLLLGIVCIIGIISFVEYRLFFTPSNQKSKADLTFSKGSGFYEDTIELKLTAKQKDATIYYTTDGSTPTEQSAKYSEPLTIKDRSNEPNGISMETGISFFGDFTPSKPIEKATVVRAFAKFKDGSTSKVMTNTYFVGKEFAEKYKDISVVSLSLDPDALYNNETGIYVKGKVYDDWVKNGGDEVNTPTWEMPANFTQTGRDWERNVHFELFEMAMPTEVSQDLGIRIIGGASRGMEQKSLKLYARKDYGKGSVDFPLFPGARKNNDPNSSLQTFDTFVLRNGGNDSWLTKFRHRFIQQLVDDRAFTTQNTDPCIVFINGEYWGIYTMTDDYSDNYIYRNYDIDKKNVIMIKRYLLEEGNDSDMNLYEDMISFARENDLSDDANYEKISEMVDIQSLIDYFVSEIYIVNGDWLNHENNWRIWRSRNTSDKPYEDGKWRYMMYDTEYSMGIYSQGKDYNVNSLKDAMTLPDDPEIPGTQIILFSSLMKNASFQKQFTNTFMDMVNYNFKLERMNDLLDKSIKEYEPFMQDYYDRFGSTHPTPIQPNPMDAFYTSVEELKVFLNNRNDYIPTMLKDTLQLKGEAVDLTVSVNDAAAGSVTINTITPDFTDGNFTGKYFTDYEVTLTANAKDGYTFIGWSGDNTSTEASIQVKPGEVANVQAQFEKK